MKSDKRILLPLLLFLPLLPAGALNVVAVSADIASITKAVAGSRAEITALATGKENLHYLQARPDYILRVSKADALISIGLDLEAAWLPAVVSQSHNPRIQPGESGDCRTSALIKPLEIPSGRVDRQMGDVHISGNPHYWMDPVNGILMAEQIRRCLTRLDPAHAKEFDANYRKFRDQLKKKTADWLHRLAPLRGAKIVSYHREFTYLASRFGFIIADTIEEKPGVSPSTARMREISAKMKSQGIKIVITAPWSNISLSQTVAEEAGARLIVLPVQTGSMNGAEEYIGMLEMTVKRLEEAAGKTK